MQKLWIMLALLAASITAQAATFKIATVLPDGTSWMKLMRGAAADIASQTEGRVKFKFYPGGVMGNDANVLRKIRAGQLHGAAFTGGTIGSFYSDIQLYSLPFLFKNAAEVIHVRSHMDAEIFAGIKANGMTPLGLAGGGFAYLMSGNPVTSLADAQKQKVWIPEADTMAEEGAKILGISPITLPIGDVYTGLQTSLIDTVATTPPGAIALQWHTKVKYVTDMPIGYVTGALVLANKSFAKISAADQTLIQNIMTRVYQEIDANSWKDNAEALAALEKAGLTLIKPTPAEYNELTQAAEQSMQKMAERGVYTVAGLAKIRRLISEFRQTQ